MFRKRPNNNFSINFSLARVVEIILSADKEPRKVIIEYYGGNSERENLEEVIKTNGMRQTTRDSLDLIVLGVITDVLNEDFKNIHKIIRRHEDSLAFVSNTVDTPVEIAPVTERCTACTKSINLPAEKCGICVLVGLSSMTEVVIKVKYTSFLGIIKLSLPQNKHWKIVMGLSLGLERITDMSLLQLLRYLQEEVSEAGGSITMVKLNEFKDSKVSIGFYHEGGLMRVNYVKLYKGHFFTRSKNTGIKPCQVPPLPIAVDSHDKIDTTMATHRIKWPPISEAGQRQFAL